jgi:hypothetical protein
MSPESDIMFVQKIRSTSVLVGIYLFLQNLRKRKIKKRKIKFQFFIIKFSYFLSRKYFTLHLSNVHAQFPDELYWNQMNGRLDHASKEERPGNISCIKCTVFRTP